MAKTKKINVAKLQRELKNAEISLAFHQQLSSSLERQIDQARAQRDVADSRAQIIATVASADRAALCDVRDVNRELATDNNSLRETVQAIGEGLALEQMDLQAQIMALQTRLARIDLRLKGMGFEPTFTG